MDALILRASPNSLSAARSLGRAGLKVVIAATGTDPAIRFSRYVSRFERLEAIDEAAIDQRLLRLPRRSGRPFLLATGDQDALLVSRHQKRLRARYCFVCPGYEVLEAMVDKARLYEIAKRNGFAHPNFSVVRGARDIDEAIAKVPTPCYVKAALGHEWRRRRRGKLAVANSTDQMRQILLDFIDMGLVAIPMEIVPGPDSEVYSVSTYIDRHGNPVGWRTKRKLRQFPLSAGNGSAQEICDEPQVAELGLRLLAITGHRGAATVEFRRDSRDGRFVLIEVNARTSLCQQLISASGLDIPLIAYHDAKELPLPAERKASQERWVSLGDDFRAFRELRKKELLTTWQWLRSLLGCTTFAYFAADDPVPFFARIVYWLSRWLRGRIRRPADSNL